MSTGHEQRIDAYARAIMNIVDAEGFTAEAEDELFRFARTFEGNDDLRSALTNQALPPERRIAVVEDLLGGKAMPVTTAVVSFIVGIGRASALPEIVDRFVALATEARSHEVAEVRSAVPLDDGQVQRLSASLSRATGKQVEVKVVVDPTVLGGLVARVGDTVIDGSVRHRLEQLKDTI
jgi:F-type H+-transporting ATPase subunit delta